MVGRAWLLVQAVTTTFWASLATSGWHIRAVGPQAQAAVTPCGCCFPGAWVPPLQSVLGPHRMGPTILSLVPHLLSEAPGILHPLIWLSSMSEISACRGSLGAHMATSNRWVKFTVMSTLPFICFPSQKWNHSLRKGEDLEMCPQKQNKQKTQAKIHNNDGS